MNLLAKTINTLKEQNLYAKKSFGQNFLISQNTLDKIIDSSKIESEDTILEIGPGTGNLTEQIIYSKPKRVLVIEKDQDMSNIIQQKFSDQIELIQLDALKFDIKSHNLEDLNYKLIANIPYYITSPLISYYLKDAFIQNKPRPKLLTLMVQYEIAEKICTTDKLNVLRANVINFGEPKIVTKVPASKFYPAPKVDSAVIQVKTYQKPIVDTDLNIFYKVIIASFSSRRKTLKNNLKSLSKAWKFSLEDLEKDTNISLQTRAEDLNLQDFERITTYILKYGYNHKK